MAQIYQSAPHLQPTMTTRAPAPANIQLPPNPRPISFSAPTKGLLNLDTFSPVNQNGSFEFDRVLKTGKVQRRVKKRGAWKPSWKPSFLVLRPNLLSIYKSEDETGLRGSITLNEITAVAEVKKSKVDNVFGVFTSAKNYYFRGLSITDSKDWIQKIRVEAGAELLAGFDLPSPQLPPALPEIRGYETTSGEEDNVRPESSQTDRAVSENVVPRSRSSTVQRSASHINEYSGNDVTSYSDFSDVPGSVPKSSGFNSGSKPWGLTPIASGQDLRPDMARNTSQAGGLDANQDPERVIRHGWLLCLRSKGRVKSWKNLWVVLRPKSISFYNSEDEYSPSKVVSISSVINTADIDPVSKSKRFCFQIIVEDKTYRLCASDEESLVKWLGALKSVLAKQTDQSSHIVKGLQTMELRQKA